MAKKLVLLVGTTKGAFFFHSDERRESWRMTGPHLGGWEVSSLMGDPRRPGRVYAGAGHFVYGATVRVSEDMGATWAQVERGPAYPADSGIRLNRIWQIVPGHPSQPDTLWAGVDEAGLFVSRDAGMSWAEVEGLNRHPSRRHWQPGNGGLCLHTIVVDPTDARRMWVAISAVGVFRSEDGGETWAIRNRGLQEVATDGPDHDVNRCVHKIVQDPAAPDTLYMQFHGGVFRSADGADSWEPIEQGLPSNFGFPMAVTRAGELFVVPLESDTHRYFPEGKLRAYRSTDGGRSWAPSGSGLPEDASYAGVLRDAMDSDPLTPGGVYVGTSMGEVFFTRDAGETWGRLPGTFPRITTVKCWVTEGP